MAIIAVITITITINSSSGCHYAADYDSNNNHVNHKHDKDNIHNMKIIKITRMIIK